MAIETRRSVPIGIELVRRGIVTEGDIEKAIEYQKTNSKKKIGDILHILNLCDDTKLINAIGEILGERAILLTQDDITINASEYISRDVMRQNMAIPFDITNGGRIKVCFADTTNRKTMETIRLLLLNRGLVMERYITFESNIEELLEKMEGQVTERITATRDITEFVDAVIKTAMNKRASDIHIEPEEDEVRIRYRIDGELITVANAEKEKQAQIIGRLKAISNMHQEKQEPQDGRILMYPNYNIRVSSQKNVYGEKFVLRLLKKNSDVRGLQDLGFTADEHLIKKYFNKRNSVAIIAAPTGEGKTTTLYSIINYLNRPEINITTIEDPVEIRIPGLNQIEIDSKTGFSQSLRTVLRQDPDVILVGEIRDEETAEIAMQAGQTGHYVLSTIHTIDAVEVITRLRKMNVSDYDIASILATSVSQRLVRKICKKCAKKREFTEQEKEAIYNISKQYGMEINLDGAYTYDAVGCKECNGSGYYDRIGLFEVLSLDEDLKDLIIKGASSIEIRRMATQKGYRPLVVDGINKVIQGLTTLEELNKKLAIF